MQEHQGKIYWQKDPMAWQYQTKYHKKGLTEQRRAKEEFVLKNYPKSDWAKAIQEQRAQVTALKAMEAELKNAQNEELRMKNSQKEKTKEDAAKVTPNSGKETTKTGKRLIKKTLYYHFPDHLGSSNLVMDETGKVIEVSDYFPYGEVRVRQSFENGFSTRKQFTGKEKDSSGLYYFGARYYDARLGRFTQPDNIASFSPEKLLVNPQLLNTYSYSRNNPLKFVDPDGNFSSLTHNSLTMIGLRDAGLSYWSMNLIRLSNLLQDSGAEFSMSAAHYDNNEIKQGDAYVQMEYDYINSLDPNAFYFQNNAEMAFGRILHAEQDFYSHTNYVEIYQKFFKKINGRDPKTTEYALYEDAMNDPKFVAFMQEKKDDGTFPNALKSGCFSDPSCQGDQHGGFVVDSLKGKGLNKDVPWRKGYKAAYDLALRKTKKEGKKFKQIMNKKEEQAKQ